MRDTEYERRLRWLIRHSFVLSLLLSVAPTMHAFAADSSQSLPAPVLNPLWWALIMWYVCSKRKTKEIGGWLLYFYTQLYVAVIGTVAISLFSFQNLLPSTWAANPSLYPLFLLSTLPTVIIGPVQLVVSEMLRRSREYRFVRALRTVLWIELAAAGVGTVIDWAQFPDNLPLDALSFIWPAVWLPYFYRSTRVTRVFKTKDWLAPIPSAPGVA